MAHAEGAYLGSVRDLESLRGRCVVDHDTGCWHLRTARGKPMPSDGRRHVIWLHGVGPVTATRAAWFVRHGQMPEKGMVVFRGPKCSYDCVRPNHLQCGTKADECAVAVQTGRLRGQPSRIMANRKIGERRAKVTLEMAGWARDSNQSAKAIAHALDISVSRAISIKAGKGRIAQVPGASVFSLGQAQWSS